jgi:transposase
MLRELHEQGLSISEIAKKTGYNRRTVRKYLESGVPPVAKRRSPKASKLDDYKDYIIQRLNSYPLTASRIYREKDPGNGIYREIYDCQRFRSRDSP